MTETELIEGLRARSADAFREAVTRFSGPMLATARAIAGAAQAEDIVQDAWITVFRQIDGFQQRAALGTWLQRIVANRAISVIRKNRREISAADTAGNDPAADWFDQRGEWASARPAWHANSPDALLTADELQDCLNKHLGEMPDNQRVVLVLRDIQGLDFESICEDLDISAANARVLLHRARLRLVKMIDHFEETGTC